MSYCEWPEFYHETYPKARKSYRCVECAAPIEVGEVHLKYRGKWDGVVGGGRQHMLCRELCKFIRDEFQDGECIGFGQLFENECDYGFTCTDYGRKQGWNATEQKARKLLAQIKWRQRKHAVTRKIAGLWFYDRKWGTSELRFTPRN